MAEIDNLNKRECKWCKKSTLKTIGRQRLNGSKFFDDWQKRNLHTKCMPKYYSWVELQKKYLKPEHWMFD